MNSRLADPYLDSMNLLNELSLLYPGAVSFGSGRPKEDLFEVDSVVSGIKDYAARHKPSSSTDRDTLNRLGQYNMTKGIINESISRLLLHDEGIIADPEDILLTDGAQEGMAIVIHALFGSPEDVLMISEPSYVGFVGYAKICGIPLCPIGRKEGGMDLDELEEKLLALRRQGQRLRAVYEVPDFHNPTAEYMPLSSRRRLLKLAEEYDFYIVEDNPYGYYLYEGEKIPALKALDVHRRVIYIGSFSKTIFPALRLGYLVADLDITLGSRTVRLSEVCKKVKSFLTVNTSALLQAMAGELLERENFSLKAFVKPKVNSCLHSRDMLLSALDRHLGGRCTVTKPMGGFFMAAECSFEWTRPLLMECVRDYGVIICPMYMFRLNDTDRSHGFRLAFSNLDPDTIETGAERLGAFIRSRI